MIALGEGQIANLTEDYITRGDECFDEHRDPDGPAFPCPEDCAALAVFFAHQAGLDGEVLARLAGDLFRVLP